MDGQGGPPSRRLAPLSRPPGAMEVERHDPPAPVAEPPRFEEPPSLDVVRPPRRPSVRVRPVERPSPVPRWIRKGITLAVLAVLAGLVLYRLRAFLPIG